MIACRLDEISYLGETHKTTRQKLDSISNSDLPPLARVASLIREKRLEAAYRQLAQRGSQMHSIIKIAYDLGFSSSSQFLRAFMPGSA